MQVVALCALAVGQPLLDLLGRHPAFFVARGTTGLDVVLLVLVLFVALPAGLIAVEVLARLISRGLGRLVHMLVVCELSAILALLLLKRTPLPDPAVLLLAMLAGVGVALLVERGHHASRYLAALSIASLVLPALFFLRPEVREVLRTAQPPDAGIPAAATKAPPVVLIVMDGMPLTSLLDRDLNIDAQRFPNIARLASHATWFRNATTVANVTDVAVPAILTGCIPGAGQDRKLATAASYPYNLFTMLSDRYRIYARESVTRLLDGIDEDVLGWSPHQEPEAADDVPSLLRDLRLVYLHLILPDAMSSRLPSVKRTWESMGDGPGAGRTTTRDLDEDGAFSSMMASYRAESIAPFIYFHSWAAHVQAWGFDRLPSGATYPVSRRLEPMLGPKNREAWPFVHQVQRSQLQMQYADAFIGRVMRSVEAKGLYDEALFILVADHGTSLLTDNDRHLDDVGKADVLAVPLFVKRPGQREGAVDDRNALTVDIVPTVAEVSGAALPGEVHGHSLLAPPPPDRRVKRAVVEGREHVFGPALDLHSPIHTARNRYGVHSGDRGVDLLGRTVAELPGGTVTALWHALEDPSLYERGSVPGVVPACVQGHLDPASDQPDVAIAVNGVIRATAPSNRAENGSVWFSALVPEDAILPGPNEIRLYEVADTRRPEPSK